jgi:hypothetical protein
MMSVVFCGLAGMASAAGPTVHGKSLTVKYTATAPLVDGRPDDACWRHAEVTEEFTLIGGTGYPTQKTAVRVLYDTEHLYILFTCFDTEITKVQAMTPPDAKDNNVVGDDSVEIFLDTNFDRASYFQIMANALGVRFDMSSREGTSWHGDWIVRDFSDAHAWYLEFRIPFTTLANLGEAAATPMPGDIWGVNFNRGIPRTSEWINWSVCHGGFHAPTQFGQLVFGERENATALRVHAGEMPQLALGNNALCFTVNNPSDTRQRLYFSLDTQRSGHQPTPVRTLRYDIPPGVERRVALPCTLLDGGTLDIAVQARDAHDTVRYCWRQRQVLPDVAGALQEAQRTLHQVNALIKIAGASPAMRAVTRECETLVATVRTLTNAYRTRAKFSPARWQTFTAEVLQMQEQVGAFERRALNTSHQQIVQATTPDACFALGNASTFDQVFSDSIFRGPILQPVSMELARREGESAQFVLIPFKDLRNVRCTVTALRRGDGEVFDAASVEVCRVIEVYRQRPANAKPDFREAWPDPLLPFTQACDLDAASVHPLWLTVYASAEQAPGVYHGAIVVEAEGGPAVSLPLTVTVHDFTLPLIPALATDMWFTPHPDLHHWYYPNQEMPLEFYERCAAFCQRYRISSYPYGAELTTFRIEIILQKDGTYSFDFSAIDRFMEVAMRHGNAAWNVNFSCNDRLAGLFAGIYGRRIQLHDQSTGKSERYPPEGHPVWDVPAHERSDYVWQNCDLFRQCLRAYWQHIQAKGWDKTAYWESVDEPNTISRMRKMQHDYAIIRQEMPGLRTLSFGVPHHGRHQGAGVGYITQWAPSLDTVPHLVNELQGYQHAGDRVWTYTCSRHVDPNSMIDSPLVMKRIVPWMCWHYDLDGYLCFTSTSYMGMNPQFKMKPEDRWPHSPWVWQDAEGGMGQNYYIYPGPDGPAASLRLAQLRDGIEDFDYLHLLQERLDQLRALKRPADAPFLKEAQSLLILAPDLLTSASQYTADGSRLLERRTKVAAAIVRAETLLRATGGEK